MADRLGVASKVCCFEQPVHHRQLVGCGNDTNHKKIWNSLTRSHETGLQSLEHTKPIADHELAIAN